MGLVCTVCFRNCIIEQSSGQAKHHNYNDAARKADKNLRRVVLAGWCQAHSIAKHCDSKSICQFLSTDALPTISYCSPSACRSVNWQLLKCTESNLCCFKESSTPSDSSLKGTDGCVSQTTPPHHRSFQVSCPFPILSNSTMTRMVPV